MAQIRDDFNEVGSYLAEKLHLSNFPNRIECYDISHIQGTNTVASMVVFQNGLPKKLHTGSLKYAQQKVNRMTFYQ